jgi:hypothetical protein
MIAITNTTAAAIAAAVRIGRLSFFSKLDVSRERTPVLIINGSSH